MANNAQVIEKLYSNLAKQNPDGMAECYHPDVEFTDSVFQGLKGPEVMGMWRMLLSANSGMQITFGDIKADDTTGSGYWEASYNFSRTGNNVLNKINSNFKFKDGLIIEHHDHFNLRKWSGQALGWQGKLLGWSPPLQKGVRKQARERLDAFMAKQAKS